MYSSIEIGSLVLLQTPCSMKLKMILLAHIYFGMSGSFSCGMYCLQKWILYIDARKANCTYPYFPFLIFIICMYIDWVVNNLRLIKDNLF